MAIRDHPRFERVVLSVPDVVHVLPERRGVPLQVVLRSPIPPSVVLRLLGQRVSASDDRQLLARRLPARALSSGLLGPRHTDRPCLRWLAHKHQVYATWKTRRAPRQKGVVVYGWLIIYHTI
jgi:hypothetical protein